MIVGNADERFTDRYSKSAVSARTALPPKACQIAEPGRQAGGIPVPKTFQIKRIYGIKRRAQRRA